VGDKLVIAQDELTEALQAKHSIGEWHWLRYHYDANSLPFQLLLSALMDCEKFIEGSGLKIAQDIGNLAGSDRDLIHYNQILQRFAEILIIKSVDAWVGLNSFAWELEKSVPASPKQVDVVGYNGHIEIGLEIKAPNFTDIQELRQQVHQMVNRLPDGRSVAASFDATLPRDNSLKDMLISANKKFVEFKRNNANFHGALVIVWDDHIQEPLTWLHGHEGLLTDNSFYKDENGDAIIFENIDAVIVLRHLTYFTSNLCNNNPFEANENMFVIGGGENLPNVIYSVSDYAHLTFREVANALNAHQHDDPILQRAAEYHPTDWIFWG
jgi:hypothetical protein